MKQWKIKLHVVSEQFFQYSLMTYLLLLLTETIKEGLVSFFFNLNILLGVVVLSGIVMITTHNEKYDVQIQTKKKPKILWWDILYTILLAFGGAVLVFIKTHDLGSLSLFISLLTGGIIVLLSILVLTERD
ncbi:MAG: hypothetical protein ACREHC_06345 [Candidatus Levyibacteriota bacterium]